MQCLVVYDIPNDKARTKIADACLDYGLDRIQFSAFLGNLARTQQEELMSKIKKVLGKKAGNVQLVTICEKDWRMRLVIDQKGADTEKSPGEGEATASNSKGEEKKRPARRSSAAQQPGRELLWMPEPEQEEKLPPF